MIELLTPLECAEVDQSLLTSRDKFSVRLAIYALGILKQISQTQSIPITEVSGEQVKEWVAQEEKIQAQVDLDTNFIDFFTNMVIASMQPLKSTAQENGVTVEELTIQQVIKHFANKQNLSKN